MASDYSEEEQVFLMSQLVFDCFLMELAIKMAEFWLEISSAKNFL